MPRGPAAYGSMHTEPLVVTRDYQWFRKTSKGSAYIVRNCS
jgi:hypothetical protein